MENKESQEEEQDRAGLSYSQGQMVKMLHLFGRLVEHNNVVNNNHFINFLQGMAVFYEVNNFYNICLICNTVV